MPAKAEAVAEGGVRAAAIIPGPAKLRDELVPATGDLLERLTDPLPGGSEEGVSGGEWQCPGKSRHEQRDNDASKQEAGNGAAWIWQLGARPLDLPPVGRVASREHRAGNDHDQKGQRPFLGRV